jgi:2-keto-4-pentenoate hydratase/2-oxohepta-3-ene-1,7-dioic acid hydratase in catechol pathway
MRWATYQRPGQPAERVGLLVDERLHGLEPGVALLDLLGDDGERLARAGERARSAPHEVVALAAVRLLAPLPRPPTIRDFYAFEQHVRAGRLRRGLEMDPDWYELPVFYFTNPYAVVAPGDDVAIPPGCQELDFELEVAAVIGRGGANLSPAEAEQCIAGYMVMNDWSARDIQRREMRQSLGPAKGKDFATSLGPYLVTPDEIAPYRTGHAFDLAMTARVNGREYSRASLADVYWSFGEMIAYAARGTRVAPGDVIGSGTCGTGCIGELSLTHGKAAYPWLKAGDEVEVAVEHLGALRQRVVPGLPLVPLRAGEQGA